MKYVSSITVTKYLINSNKKERLILTHIFRDISHGHMATPMWSYGSIVHDGEYIAKVTCSPHACQKTKRETEGGQGPKISLQGHIPNSLPLGSTF
jgi:hypothetical protein